MKPCNAWKGARIRELTALPLFPAHPWEGTHLSPQPPKLLGIRHSQPAARESLELISQGAGTAASAGEAAKVQEEKK